MNIYLSIYACDYDYTCIYIYIYRILDGLQFTCDHQWLITGDVSSSSRAGSCWIDQPRVCNGNCECQVPTQWLKAIGFPSRHDSFRMIFGTSILGIPSQFGKLMRGFTLRLGLGVLVDSWGRDCYSFKLPLGNSFFRGYRLVAISHPVSGGRGWATLSLRDAWLDQVCVPVFYLRWIDECLWVENLKPSNIIQHAVSTTQWSIFLNLCEWFFTSCLDN